MLRHSQGPGLGPGRARWAWVSLPGLPPLLLLTLAIKLNYPKPRVVVYRLRETADNLAAGQVVSTHLGTLSAFFVMVLPDGTSIMKMADSRQGCASSRGRDS